MSSLYVLIITVVLSSSVKSQANPKWIPMECKEGSYVPGLPIMEKLPACSDPTVYGKEADKKHPNCGFYCAAEVFGMLGEDGRTSNEIYDAWVEASFPDKYKEIAKEHFRGCFETSGNQIDDNDAECKAAAAFMQCTWEVMPKMPC